MREGLYQNTLSPSNLRNTISDTSYVQPYQNNHQLNERKLMGMSIDRVSPLRKISAYQETSLYGMD